MGLRVTRRWGPARIGFHLGLNPSTVHRVLARYRCPRLKWTDPATGTRIKTSGRDKHRYEHAAAGDLIHVEAIVAEADDATLQVTVQYVVRQTQQRQVAQVEIGVGP